MGAENDIYIICCFGALDDCQNLDESYGEICVRCNKCGRFGPGLSLNSEPNIYHNEAH